MKINKTLKLKTQLMIYFKNIVKKLKRFVCYLQKIQINIFWNKKKRIRNNINNWNMKLKINWIKLNYWKNNLKIKIIKSLT